MADPIIDKSKQFAIDIVNISRYLQNTKKEYVLSNQLLRSGTSIGANIREAKNGQSQKDFLAKMYISFKEANETEYWLELLMDTNTISLDQGTKLLKDCQELKRILSAITLTAKKNLAESKKQ